MAESLIGKDPHLQELYSWNDRQVTKQTEQKVLGAMIMVLWDCRSIGEHLDGQESVSGGIQVLKNG